MSGQLEPKLARIRYHLLQSLDHPSKTQIGIQFPADNPSAAFPYFEDVTRHPLLLPWNQFLTGGSNELGTLVYHGVRFAGDPMPRIMHAISVRKPEPNGIGGPDGAIHIFPGLLADWMFEPEKPPIGIHHVTVRPTDKGTIRRYVKSIGADGNATDQKHYAETDEPMTGLQYLMAMGIRGPEDLWPAGMVTRSIEEKLAKHIAQTGLRGPQASHHFCSEIPVLPQPSFLMTVYSLGHVRDDLTAILPFHGEFYRFVFGEKMAFPPGQILASVASVNLEPLGFKDLGTLHITHMSIPRALPNAAVIHVGTLGKDYAGYAAWATDNPIDRSSD